MLCRRCYLCFVSDRGACRSDAALYWQAILLILWVCITLISRILVVKMRMAIAAVVKAG